MKTPPKFPLDEWIKVFTFIFIIIAIVLFTILFSGR